MMLDTVIRKLSSINPQSCKFSNVNFVPKNKMKVPWSKKQFMWIKG